MDLNFIRNVLFDWMTRFKRSAFTSFVLLLISTFICFCFWLTIAILSTISGYPLSQVIPDQLGFNATRYKEHFAKIQLSLFKATYFIDYGFMISYSAVILCLFFTFFYLLRSADALQNSVSVAFYWTFEILFISMIVICDAIENAIMLIFMLSDPLEFASSYAILHSLFALLKWIGVSFNILYIIVVVVYLGICHVLYNRKRKKEFLRLENEK